VSVTCRGPEVVYAAGATALVVMVASLRWGLAAVGYSPL
jgi:hypothetical protein